jgi:cysteinyl-tRNA synthetase
VEKSFEPAVIRHFILTSHYRAPLDFSNEALKGAEAGSYKLRDAVRELAKAARARSERGAPASAASERGVQATGSAAAATAFAPGATARAMGATALEQCAAAAKSDAVRAALTNVVRRFADAMNEDFNTAAAIATVFDFTRHTGTWVREAAPAEDLLAADALMQRLVGDALGLKWQDTAGGAAAEQERNALIQVLADLRNDARKSKNFALGDQVRQRLTALGIELKDGPQGTTW